MIAVVDTSILLRKLFGEKGAFAGWNQLDEAFVSRLVEVEIGRVIDRARLGGSIDDEQVEHLHREARAVLAAMHVVSLSDAILLRAAGPMPTTLGTLDAIHLATALEVSAARGPSVVLLTHDAQLARAGTASGLDVLGM